MLPREGPGSLDMLPVVLMKIMLLHGRCQQAAGRASESWRAWCVAELFYHLSSHLEILPWDLGMCVRVCVCVFVQKHVKLGQRRRLSTWAYYIH